jgi:hypothetical protein
MGVGKETSYPTLKNSRPLGDLLRFFTRAINTQPAYMRQNPAKRKTTLSPHRIVWRFIEKLVQLFVNRARRSQKIA